MLGGSDLIDASDDMFLSASCTSSIDSRRVGCDEDPAGDLSISPFRLALPGINIPSRFIHKAGMLPSPPLLMVSFSVIAIYMNLR